MNCFLVKILREFPLTEKLFLISVSTDCIFMTSKEWSSLKTPTLCISSIPLPKVVNKFTYAINLKTLTSQIQKKVTISSSKTCCSEKF